MKNLFGLLFFFLFAVFCRGEFKFWSCVVYAKLGKSKTDSSLDPYTNDMQRIFGYQHYEILGSQWSSHSIDQPNYLAPTQEFALKLIPLTVPTDTEKFYLKLYQKKDILLKSRIRLPQKSPLYIAGPSYGKGKIIFIIDVKTEPKK